MDNLQLVLFSSDIYDDSATGTLAFKAPNSENMILDLLKHGIKCSTIKDDRKYPVSENVLVISSLDDDLNRAVMFGVASAAYKEPKEIDSGKSSPVKETNSSPLYASSQLSFFSSEKATELPMVIEGFDEIDYDFINRIFLRFHGLPVTIAETERLIIREFTEEDSTSLYSITDLFDSREKTESWLKDYIKNVYPFFDYGYWGVYEKSTGKLIGECGINSSEINGQYENEIGYIIAPASRKKGYASETIGKIFEIAKERYEMKRVVALIEEGNTASVHTAESLGMHFEARFAGKDYKHKLVYVKELG